jgi:hypothetical protein
MKQTLTKMMTLGLLVVAMASTGCDKTAMALVDPEKAAELAHQPAAERQASWWPSWYGGY